MKNEFERKAAITVLMILYLKFFKYILASIILLFLYGVILGCVKVYKKGKRRKR